MMQKLKKVLPDGLIVFLKSTKKFLISLYELFENYSYDSIRFFRYSTTASLGNSFEQLEARIIAHCHVIEKGLSLKETRLGYGRNVIDALMDLLEEYLTRGYPLDEIAFQSALSVLHQYILFHEMQGHEVVELKNRLREMPALDDYSLGGIIELNREEVLTYTEGDFSAFSKNRYSVRNFSDEPVEKYLLERAVQIAQKTPSVCNRQSSKVYIIEGSDLKKAVLDLQSGNRGFGHLADKILIVTSDLRAFSGINERNQSFVDGGMFSMSLLYGLYHVGLAACTLNWSVKKDLDVKLKNIAEIPKSENIILLIAVGHFPERFNVAKSTRKNLDDILFLRNWAK